MKHLLSVFCVWVFLGASVAVASPLPMETFDAMAAADVVLLGEVHDNPVHHERQAELVARLHPRAVVWEMFTEVGAGLIDAALIEQPDRLEQTLDWSRSGWPEFAMYYPIFKAAPDARIYGGNVPRAAARDAAQTGPAVAFGADAARYGLTIPLPREEQAAREAFQKAAHCDALPDRQLVGMVAIQRLRDAVLARAVIRAMDETGGPVVVITGNGHARRDWGIASYLERVRPALRVFALGQSEDGGIEGTFDAVLDAPAIARDDPCDAFRSPSAPRLETNQ